MIYFLQSPDGGPVKIGFTGNLEHRHRALEAHYGRPLALLATVDGGRNEERAIHERFAHLRFGKTEQFRPTRELMEFIDRPLLVGLNPEAVEKMAQPWGATVKLPDDDYERLKRAAKRVHISVAAYIRQAVMERIESDEAKGGLR